MTARANDGVWNGGRSRRYFSLAAALLSNRLVLFAPLVSALALSVYASYRWRVRQVEAQFNAVLAERNRIAREIHDTLAQGFVADFLAIGTSWSRKLDNAPQWRKRPDPSSPRDRPKQFE